MRIHYPDVELPYFSDFGIGGSYLDSAIGHEKGPVRKGRNADELIKDIEIPGA